MRAKCASFDYINMYFVQVLLIICLLSLCFPFFAQEGNLKGYTIYSIARHVEWPELEDTSQTFNFGLIGNDSVTNKIYNAFKFAEKFRKLEKKKIRVIRFEKPEEIENIRVLYVNGSGLLNLEKIKEKISSRPTLLITENYPFSETMINMLSSYKRGRFEVNKTNMRKAGFNTEGSVDFFSSRSEENIENAEDLIGLISDSVDVELNAEDLAVVVEEYNSMLEQITTQKQEIVEQTAELEGLLDEIEGQKTKLKRQQTDLQEKELMVAQSKHELAQLLAENQLQQDKLQSAERALKTEMAALDSVHSLLENQLQNFEAEQRVYRAELNKQDSLISIKKQQIAQNEETIQKQMSSLDSKNRQIEGQQMLIWIGVVFSIALIGIAFLIYKNYKNKKKAHAELESKNAIIEEQKTIVEEKNREITDSINYAKRIQEAILPPIEMINASIPNNFVLYKPKDIVAGDFYWFEKVGNTSIIAAADCTGHGVPGAMVSVICNNALQRSVREFNLSEPGEILNKTRELVLEQFALSTNKVADGMDIAICSLTPAGQQISLQYAGAHNPLWIIRNGSNQVEEYKATKQPIGHVDVPLSFTTHELQLHKGDTFYIFSDGYADQFGGEKGKKFKTKAFKQLLLSSQSDSLQAQCELIDEAFENWRGDLEQVDDVCVIGVRA